jgi:TolB-like protein
MYCLKIRFIILSFLYFIFISCSSHFSTVKKPQESSEEFSKVVQTIALELDKANPSDRLIRLGIISISPSYVNPKDTDFKNEFGEYFTEKLISYIKRESKKFKLFERARLDVILKEHALALSGMINEQSAKKIGELAPIDVIFSGSYTKLKNCIDVNCRLIDVVSGEILLTYTGRIKLTENLAALFKYDQPLQSGEEVSYVVKDPCAPFNEEINRRLNDLSSTDKVQIIVDIALKIPFDLECGKIHFSIIYAFKRYKIENENYRLFLINELKGLDFPGNDDRALQIFKYLSKDGKISDKEWNTGLQVLRKIGSHALSSHIAALLYFDRTMEISDQTFKRIDEYFELAKTKQIGLPAAIDFNSAFFEMMEAFNYIYNKDNGVFIYSYRKYKDLLTLDKKGISKIFGLLRVMYWREKEINNKTKILRWICDHFNQIPIDDKTAENLYSFSRKMETELSKKNDFGKPENIPSEHLNILVESCSDLFCKGLCITKFRSQREDRIDFCLKNNIPCPDNIPTIKECLNMLSSQDVNERIRGAEILEKMGEKAKAAEAGLIKIFSDKVLAHGTEINIINRHIAKTFGNIRTTNPKALELLTKAIGSLGYKVPGAATDALVMIGKPAAPYLIKALKSQFGSVQVRAAVALGKMGSNALSAKAALKKLLKSTKNQAVHSAAEQALREISK